MVDKISSPEVIVSRVTGAEEKDCPCGLIYTRKALHKGWLCLELLPHLMGAKDS